jgi:integrase
MSARVLRFCAPSNAPTLQSPKAMPRRRPNTDLRTREYLTPDEVEQLQRAAASVGRHGHRDATLIMLAYRHGLRVSELVALRWDQINLKAGALHVGRLKAVRACTRSAGPNSARFDVYGGNIWRHHTRS